MTRPLSRRQFLGRVTAGAAALTSGYALSVWQADDRLAAATLRTRGLGGRNDRTLVVLELGGGNDTLNTVVPHADPAYRALRPTLAVVDPIDLDGEIGLHPSLPKLAARYGAGEVAIVEGLGYDQPDLSHFGSSAVWWTARGGTGGGGWLGAYLDATVGFDDPLAAIGIGPNPTPALLGQRSFATTIADESGLTPELPAWADGVDNLLASWSGFSPARIDPDGVVDEVRRAIGLTVTARDQLDRALGELGRDAAPDAVQYDAAVSEPLDLAARLIRSPARPRVVYVGGIGDYDTHDGQAVRHPELLAQLDDGIESFFGALGNAADRVALMTVSEFGRRPAENGGGTDHGTAGAQLVVGPQVRGGRYGRSPSLTQLDATGNLDYTTDFRSLYASALSGWLDVEHEPVLGEQMETFNVFR